MKEYKFRTIKLTPIIGLGYWRDDYTKAGTNMNAYAHNFILPFIRIQFATLLIKSN